MLAVFFNVRFTIVKIIKSASGHGKGAIDAAHTHPKKVVTRYYKASGGAGLSQEPGNYGFQTATELVSYMMAQPRFGLLTDTKCDSLGFKLIGRFVEVYTVYPGIKQVF